MSAVRIMPEENLGGNFIPGEYLPENGDEYRYRNMQSLHSKAQWRHLRSDEVERLVKNNNTASSWDSVLVTDDFDTNQIKNTDFYGLVRIGAVRNIVLEHHDLRTPAGITNSVIISSDIGNDAALHNVRYLAHYIVGEKCILLNIDEMHTTNYAKFGNGIVKKGESESVRVWLDVMNEAGGRRILPFDGMLPADAYLWAKYRDDIALQAKLIHMTQNMFDDNRGWYGTVGGDSVIKNSRILKDVKIGSHCYIKGANKLKNLTVNSSEEEPTQIGEGVELVNGIIGYGCNVFYGCKAVRFIMADHSKLKYGARLINSFLGENSTISCCEVLNNLIFPAHEQHHNNSFLIASVVKGQSNVAAGVTIGSNHNSRANDNEIEAGRGFWPGLCTSLKHSSRFASFTLLAKADYPNELDIKLPFSLVSNDVSADRLTIMPAFWWLYNMYALARNTSKYLARDRRLNRAQHIEFDYLAPDTVEEIITAMGLLEEWTGSAHLQHQAQARGGSQLSGSKAGGAGVLSTSPAEASRHRASGRALLTGSPEVIGSLTVKGEGMEKSSRPVVILKPHKAYAAYREMIFFYAVKNIIAFIESRPGVKPEEIAGALKSGKKGKRVTEWGNLGGQIMPEKDIDTLRSDIGKGKLSTWDKVHQRYDRLWEAYTLEKQKHAYACLLYITGAETLTEKLLKESVEKARKIQEYIRDQVYLSRKKDYENSVREKLFRNREEMDAVLGTIDDNDFVKQVRLETEVFLKKSCFNQY